MATYAPTTDKAIKKAVEKVKAHPGEYRIEDQIRVVGRVNTKDEIAALHMMETLDKVENKDYKDWVTQRFYDIYPEVMNRLYGSRPAKKTYVPVEEK